MRVEFNTLPIVFIFIYMPGTFRACAIMTPNTCFSTAHLVFMVLVLSSVYSVVDRPRLPSMSIKLSNPTFLLMYLKDFKLSYLLISGDSL